MPPHPEPPQAQLARGLRPGNLNLIRAAASQLGPLPLRVAFEVLTLIGRHEPQRWPSAAVRFVGRVALEQPGIGLDDITDLASVLRDGDPEQVDVLRRVQRRIAVDLQPGLSYWPPSAATGRSSE